MGSSKSPMTSPAPNPKGLTSPANPAGAPLSCRKCGESKPPDAFEPTPDKIHRRKTCRSCRNAKSGVQVERIAERRRVRKAAERSLRQQQAEQTIQNLIWALDRVPAGEEYDEWREQINRSITRIRKSGRRTEDAAVRAVLDAFSRPFNRNGASAADISSDTEIPEREVKKILDGLISLNQVYRAPKEVPEIARGATIWLYFLTGAKARTSSVLP